MREELGVFPHNITVLPAGLCDKDGGSYFYGVDWGPHTTRIPEPHTG